MEEAWEGEENHEEGKRLFMVLNWSALRLAVNCAARSGYQRTCRCRQWHLHHCALLVLLTHHSFSRAVRIATGGFYCFWVAEV